MKKIVCCVLAFLLLIADATIFIVAAEEKVGFYNIGIAAGVTITAKDSNGAVSATAEDVDKDGTIDTFYSGSDRLDVSYSRTEVGNTYIVALVEGSSYEEAIKDSKKVYYLNQQIAIGAILTFNVIPLLPSHTMDMTLFILSDDGKPSISVPLSYLVDTAHNLTRTAAVDADCENAGNNEYWTCSECGKFFSDEEGTIEIQENSWVIPALGHDYEISYEWSADNSSVVGNATCSRDESHTATQTVNVEISTTPATCAAAGERTYTALFTEDPFTTQVKTEQIIKLDHDYGDPQWYWNENLTTASAGFPCSKCNHIEIISGDVLDRTVVPGVHETPGYITATGRVIFQGRVYFDPKEIETAAPGHVYGTPVWEWAEDGSSAYLVATCIACDNAIRVEASVTPSGKDVEPTCTDNGQAKFIATAKYNGEWLTDIHTLIIPALGHEYGEPVWEWAKDFSTATAVFTCGKDNSHKYEITALLEKGTIETDDSIVANKYEDVQKSYKATIIGPDEKTYEDIAIETIKATHRVKGKSSKDGKSVIIDVATDTLNATVKGSVSVVTPAIIVSYDEDSRFLGLDVVTKEVEDVAPAEDAESIKILWIDSDDYRPRVEAEEIQRQ